MSSDIPETEEAIAYADRDAVLDRLGDLPEDVLADEATLTMIDAYLEDASDAARYYGKNWPAASAPKSVSRIVATAVARFMRNPEGLSQSRASDETLGWHKPVEIDWFTTKEIERLAKLATPIQTPSFGSFGITAYDHQPRHKNRDAYVPVSYGGKPFPMGR